MFISHPRTSPRGSQGKQLHRTGDEECDLQSSILVEQALTKTKSASKEMARQLSSHLLKRALQCWKVPDHDSPWP